MLKRVLCFIIIFHCFGLVYAWDNLYSHKIITDKAFGLLNGNYQEGLEKNTVIGGAYNEDVPSKRGAFHFYNPVTDEGLNFWHWGELRVFSSSIELATSENIHTGYPFFVEVNDGLNSWSKSIEAYGNGNKTTAFEKLGRVLHLITQDLLHLVQSRHG